MPTTDPLVNEEYAVITAVTPGALTRESSDAREGVHRPVPLPGSSRGIRQQQSDACISQSTQFRPPLQRGQSQIQQAIASSAKFVGIPYAEKSPDLSEWDSRRLRFLNKRYKLKESAIKHSHPPSFEVGESAPTSLTPVQLDTPFPPDHRLSTAGTSMLVRTISQESRPRHEKKDSVVKVVYDTVSSIIKRGTTSRPKPRHQPLSTRSSFDAPDDFMPSPILVTDAQPLPLVREAPEEEEIAEKTKLEEPVIEKDGGEWVELFPIERPDTLGLPPTRPPQSYRRRMLRGSHSTTYDGEGNPIPPPRHCLAQLPISSGHPFDDEGDGTKPPPRKSKSWAPEPKRSEASEPLNREDPVVVDSQLRTHVRVPYNTEADLGSSRLTLPPQKVSLEPPPQSSAYGDPDRGSISRKTSGNIRAKELTQGEQILERMSKFVSPRRVRYRGVGPIGRCCNHYFERKKVDKLDPQIRSLLEKGEDHRPFFTYWVTTVQVLVCIISLCFYGFGPINFFERVEKSDEVPDVSLAPRRVSYFEPASIWIGPSFADLVRLGAKYSPCMRRENSIWNEIALERKKENDTGCCIFNDRTGCYQASQHGCNMKNLATWMKWRRKESKTLTRSKSDTHLLHLTHNQTKLTNLNSIAHHRQAGAVCGQDPDYCVVPRSKAPREWEDDLTKWPICKETRTEGFLPPHMTCQITGRPCCIQMQGLCRIATKEYCDFVQGYWHSNATLCSQVDCFGDICGMLPFFNKDHPNQVYRLFTSLFIHAGLVHLFVTIMVQRMLMSDLETLIGWKRMAFVYIGSGIGGNLASAIFVPYNPEVGPSGSQLGILAALIVDVIHHRKLIKKWHYALLEHIGVVCFLLLIGTVPYIDNWAHIFGFIFGLLISLICFPYLDLSGNDALSTTLGPTSKFSKLLGKFAVNRRTLLVIGASIAVTFLYFGLGYIYFSNIEINCPLCQYVNCVNYFSILPDHYCDNKGMELSHWLPI